MSEQNKKGLGRGFEALLPSNFKKENILSPNEKIINIELSKLSPNKNQPRTHFDKKALEELASSIKQYGVIQPILVTPLENDEYGIVAGERRFRASKIAGLKTIPAVIKKRQELEQLEIALIENIQRENLNPLEQALSIERLKQQFNFSLNEIAKRMGKAVSTVNNLNRLIDLPENAKDALMKKLIVEGHARQILSLNGDRKMQDFLLNEIVSKKWSVRQAEQFVTTLKLGIKDTAQASERTQQRETQETKALSKILDTKVTLRRMANGGKLEITYKNDEDLGRILKRIN